ncbi:MAG: endonuclease/exonuclease/phosphatase family protein [Actinomycetota bacterium]|nr:endonuclease/exonuclease/phosphatase family protein [Actinomycetota bacterium]
MSTWRVVTWNLRGSRRVPVLPIAEVLRSFRPDVVAVQEVRRRQAHRLAAELGFGCQWVLKHYPLTPLLWWRAEGMAIITPHHLSDGARTVLSAGRSTWTFRRRIMIAATVRRDGEVLRVHDVHLEGQGPERVHQAQRAAAAIAAEALVPAAVRVVAGDLNASNDPATVQPFLALGLADPGGHNTSPAGDPQHRVDYVLVPAGAAVEDRYVPPGGPPWDVWSDHLPFVVQFLLPLSAANPGSPAAPR